MLPKQALVWMLHLEESIGDLSFRYGFVDIWPVVRNTLILAVLNKVGKPWPPRKQKLGRGKRLFRSLISLIRTNRSDILFVTDTKYSECIEGKYYIKDVDGVSKMEENKGKTLEMAFSDEPDRPLSHDISGAISLYAVLVLASILTKVLCLFPMPQRISKLLDTVCEAYALSGSATVSKFAMRKRLKKNIVFSGVSCVLLRLLLKRTRPEKVYIHCYYSPFGMGLCAAAKSCGVEITDVQHGLAGRNMRAYGQWGNAPKGGFSTMPSSFFSWTEEDAQAINEWSQTLGLGKIALCTGQLWSRTFRESQLYEKALKEWDSFLREISGYERKIAITLQFPEIDASFLNLIASSNEQTCFLVRAHPNARLSDLSSELNGLNTKANIYLAQSTRIPIHLLFDFSDLHITGWSASVYEARESGTESEVFDLNGFDYFEGYERALWIRFADNLTNY